MARRRRHPRESVTLADALRAAFDANAEQLLAGDPSLEDAEAVHDLRVAARTVRSLLRTYRPVLDASWAATTSAELGWLAGELDALRDIDVRRSRLLAALSGDPTSPGDAPVLDEEVVAAMLRRLELDHDAARSAFVASRQSPRAELLRGRLLELADAPFSARAGAPAEQVVPQLLERPWRDLRAASRLARASRAVTDLHALRLRSKQLRYSAELAAPLVQPGLERVARSCGALSQRLGEHRDALETAAWLATVADSPQLAFAAGQLYAGEWRRAEQATADLDGRWRELRRRWRRWQAARLG